MEGPLDESCRGDEMSSDGLSPSSASEGEVEEENAVGGKEEEGVSEGDGEESDSEGKIEDSFEGARRRLAPHVVMNA